VTTNRWPSESEDTNAEVSAHQRAWTLDARERMAAKIEALWQDPTYRTTMSAKMRTGWARRKRRLSERATR
jgi:hypothetical protein